MLHSILLRTIQEHLTLSEITLLCDSHSTLALEVSQLHIASPHFYHYCCTIFSLHLDSVFIHYSKHIEWAEFTRLYTQQQQPGDIYFNLDLAETLIRFHRPIRFLNHICHQSLLFHLRLCQYAAQYNNIPALETLRDPNTGSGVCAWSNWTCIYAAVNGHTDALSWLRDPTKGGGVCPWCKFACIYAAEFGQLDALIWLRNPTTGGGACPWDQQQCLKMAQKHNHPHIATWIRAQHNDNDIP